MRFDFDKKTESFVSRTATDIIADKDTESESKKSNSGDESDVEMSAEMDDSNELETSDDDEVNHCPCMKSS